MFFVASLSLILLTSTVAFSSQAFAQNFLTAEDVQPSSKNPNFVSGQVIVGLKQHDNSFKAKANTIGGKVIDENTTLKAHLIQVPNNAEDAFIKAISKNPNVLFAEKNYITQPLFTPNDPYWNNYQWNMKIIQADDAWDVLPTNPSDVVVAVVDTGVQWNHRDLKANTIQGWDSFDNDSNPMDESGHGTHVAGTIGAITNNGVGVAGVAQVKIMPVRVLGPEGGPDWVVANGITYATENGADVINLSLGCYCPSLTLTKMAIDHAYIVHDKLVVAAAGNDNTSFPHYPSSFASAMSVAATNKNDNKASYSNFGSTIEISAPGGDSTGSASESRVLSTYPKNSYAYGYGTSMATPHVAGVAALILSQNNFLYGSDVRGILKNTSDDLGTFGWDQFYGEGRVNAYAAVSNVPPPTLLTPTTPLSLSATAISDSQIDLSWTTPTDDGGAAITGYMIKSESPIDDGFTTLVADTGSAATSYSDSGLSPLTQHNYRVSAINSVGTSTASNPSAATTLPGSTTTDLSVSIDPEFPTYSPKSFAYITVEVTDGENAVGGASVTLTVTDPNGRDKTLSGTTDNDTGEVTFKYRIPPNASTGDEYYATATVSATGFNSESTPVILLFSIVQ